MATVTETQTHPTEIEPEGRYELVDGQVVEKPYLGVYESAIASMLITLMAPFSRSNGLGRTYFGMLFLIDPARRLARRPDVAFVSSERWPIQRRAPRAAAWEVVPDLAVEVVSPTNRTMADATKLEDYFRAGVKRVWMVYPDLARIYDYDSPTSVTILSRGDALDGKALLPGFRLPLDDLFGEPAE